MPKRAEKDGAGVYVEEASEWSEGATNKPWQYITITSYITSHHMQINHRIVSNGSLLLLLLA